MYTVLIVEDDALKFRALRRVLVSRHPEPKNLEVLWAPSVAEGVVLLGAGDVNFVVTDMGLPMESGESATPRNAGNHVVDAAEKHGVLWSVWTGGSIPSDAYLGWRWFSVHENYPEDVVNFILTAYKEYAVFQESA